jgi:hypothetical protein
MMVRAADQAAANRKCRSHLTKSGHHKPTIGENTMYTRKQYAAAALSGVIGLGIAALVTWLAYSGNDDPNGSGIQSPQMPVSLTTFLIGIGSVIVLIFVTLPIIWVEVITPWRAERAHRNRLAHGYDDTDKSDTHR